MSNRLKLDANRKSAVSPGAMSLHQEEGFSSSGQIHLVSYLILHVDVI